jgi:tetratricopeptide (TPR) repeat protein
VIGRKATRTPPTAERRRHHAAPLPAPDLSVELDQSRRSLRSWRAADRAGSADAAVILGLLATQRGRPEAAAAAWRRADARGSADGAFLFGLSLHRAGDSAGAEAAWQRADERGSAGAAGVLANLADQRGDAAACEDALLRLKARATAEDARGTAAGALQVAFILARANDAGGAEAAFRRADERGSGAAAVSLAGMLFRRNDLDGAEAALRRADQRNNALGTVNLGALLAQRGEIHEAKRVWRRARRLASARGEPEVADAATAQLRKHGESWLREHRRFLVLTVAGLVTAGVTWGWTAVVGVVLAAIAAVYWHTSGQINRRIPIAEAPTSVGGAQAEVGGLTAAYSERPLGEPLRRRRNERDRRAWRVIACVIASFGVVVLAWSGDFISFDILVRSGYAAIAAVILVYTLWRIPDLRAVAAFEEGSGAPSALLTPRGREGMRRFTLTWSPLRFLRIGVLGQVNAPTIQEPPPPPTTGAPSRAERSRPWAQPTAYLVAAALAAALALAPDRRAALTHGWSILSPLLEIALVAVGLGAAVQRCTRGIRRRDRRELWLAALSIGMTAGLLAIAYALGWLDSWIELGR